MRKPKITDDVTPQSVLECRRIFREMTVREFAAWYERRYGIPEKRVLAILKRQEEKACTD